LDNPWQIQPTGVKGALDIVHAKTLEQHGRDGHNEDIRYAFREIE
jgi:hypothetical protein